MAMHTNNAFNTMHVFNGADRLPDIPIAPPIMIYS